jgi:hypothetical protein
MFDKSPLTLYEPRWLRAIGLFAKEGNTRKSPPLENGDEGGFYKLYMALFLTFVLSIYNAKFITESFCVLSSSRKYSLGPPQAEEARGDLRINICEIF